MRQAGMAEMQYSQDPGRWSTNGKIITVAESFLQGVRASSTISTL